MHVHPSTLPATTITGAYVHPYLAIERECGPQTRIKKEVHYTA